MKRSNYMLAALTSAVLPNLAIAGVRGSTQPSATDEGKGIDQAVVQDASGKLYDVYATDTKEGRARLTRRASDRADDDHAVRCSARGSERP